jgi:hypothetical protein
VDPTLLWVGGLVALLLYTLAFGLLVVLVVRGDD